MSWNRYIFVYYSYKTNKRKCKICYLIFNDKDVVFHEGFTQKFLLIVSCVFQATSLSFPFARTHISSLINIEKTLSTPITKFYNGDYVNGLPTSFFKKHNLL